MNVILKGIGAILGLFILFGFLGNIIGSHDISAPGTTGGSNIEVKIAYTRDGQNFVSKERVEENIKYGYARPGDYKEVQVPIHTVVVGASIVPEDSLEKEDEVKENTQTSQNIEISSYEQSIPAQDEEWINNVLETNAIVSQEFEILLKAASNYQIEEIQRHCNRLEPIVYEALQTSKSYDVLPQYRSAKELYEVSMQEFYEGCNEVLDGIDAMNTNMMYKGKDHIINGKDNLDKVLNSLKY